MKLIVSPLNSVSKQHNCVVNMPELGIVFKMLTKCWKLNSFIEINSSTFIFICLSYLDLKILYSSIISLNYKSRCINCSFSILTSILLTLKLYLSMSILFD